jgi:hypothetical protein
MEDGMIKKNLYIELVRVADFSSNNDKYVDPNLIDYFIKKFADDDPSRLVDIYDNIPDEEKGDLMDAIKSTKGLPDSESDFDNQLDEVYKHLISMHKDDNEFVMASDGDMVVTVEDVINTLNIGEEELI